MSSYMSEDLSVNEVRWALTVIKINPSFPTWLIKYIFLSLVALYVFINRSDWLFIHCFAGDRTVALPNLGWLGPALLGLCTSSGCESLRFICSLKCPDLSSAWHLSTLKCKGRLSLFTCNLILLVSSSLLSAWYASSSGRHESSRTWHKNPLPVWRFEQKRPVCTDSRQRYRYKIQTRDRDNLDIVNDNFS